MSKMCQSCCLGQNTQVSGDEGRRPLCKACEEMNTESSSSEENTLWSSSAGVNGSSPCTASMTSPSVSFSKYGNPRLSYDGVQPYVNSQVRNDEADGLDTGQRSPVPGNAGYMEGHGNGILFTDITVEIPNANNLLNELKIPMSPEDNYSCKSLALNSCRGNTNENNELGSHAFSDGQWVGSGDDVTENVVNNDISPFLSNSENDPHIWTPPEPEDIEYDTDSVAYEDEDDGYNDGTPWSQPSLLSSSLDDVGNYHTHKEEREKAMMEAMNGQFKFLVSRLLASEGMGLADGEDGKNWLDIATSLSWDAALLIKPGPNEGRAMDPGSYVKVKCIASGARTDSQVIKGLVFKKSTTHKHMPTELKNPRILLLQGSLGRSANGFSSFGSMKEEEDYIKALIDMIESCRPHVVLVEKTVPRDIQESLLDRGITVIFDMKISRLERIARCLGSQIVSSADILARPKLKQCDTFRIEKFVEEHNCSGEGGKKSIKTLMFLEGCPRPLGCTILLKGAHIDELKKVKRVVQYTVFAAYHLILETSFFVDQRTFIYDKNGVKELNDTSANKSVDSESCDGSSIMQYLKVNGQTTDAVQLHALEIPISDGSVKGLTMDEVNFNSDLDGGSSLVNASRSFVASVENETICSNQLHDTHYTDEYIQCDSAGQALAPGLMLSSVSTSLRKFLGDDIPSLATDSISSCRGFNENLSSNRNRIPVSPQPEACDHGKGRNGEMVQKKLDSGFINKTISLINPDRSEAIEQCNKRNINEMQIEITDDIEGTLDPQSILVLLSAYCIPKQTVCGQSHLSRIKYYGNFDISLGRYLQGILLNQKYSCPSCGEPPEHHIYCYTHKNGNLTVRVRSLPKESTLFGEAEGKIWMWTRCLKCQHESGNTKPTRRVVMSSAACGLSFGKFLELSFSGHFAATRLSRCGHSLHRDCLRFFGLGSKVAMFKYSSVEIFTACKPSPVLEFAKSSDQEWYAREARDVLSKGDVFFMEVANLLDKLKMKCPNAFLKRSIKSSGLAVEFDKVEEMLAQEKTDFEASLLKATVSYSHANEDEIFGLNWHLQELLLLLYIWDCRLHSIFLCWSGDVSNDVKQIEKENDVIYSNNYRGESMSKDGHEFLEIPIEVPFDAKESCAGESNGKDPYLNGSNEVQLETEAAETCEEKCSPDMKEDGSVLVLIGPAESAERATNLDTANDKFLSHGETNVHKSHKSEVFELEDPGKWIWSAFSELRKALRKDLNAGFLQKFRFINTYKPTHLSPMQQLTTLVADTLHFPVGAGGSVISVVEDEISSIISCALALSQEGDGNVQMDNATDYSHFSTLNGSIPLAHSPTSGHLEPEKMKQSRSFSSISSDDLTAFGSDGTFFADRMIPSSVAIHPQIPVGSGKLSGKCKYSVVCVYAKQFYSLRKRCCSSELAYISSLSHCRKWDAQGGKSKVFFGKTMDDRFIIKQIKKAELESFLKFGPDYFKHITGSLDSGSQTCLAKILGVYQVRQYKSGKEIKTDVVVMENLFFGRDISRKYDLKGAVFSRYVSNSKDSECVLLDENFVEDMSVSPIYVGGKNKHLLQRAIWNDTSFLTSINVMDYSLLVGVDKQKHEIVFGIIDYLRQYTWDKQLETWVKASLVVPKNELPTVISPKEYKKRFRKFMARYFLTVPDDWNSEQCSGTCKFCTNGSSNLHNANCQSRKMQCA